MVKGVSIKFRSYEETIPKLLELIKFGEELKKHNRIVLKPYVDPENAEKSTSVAFLESIIKFAMENKNPGTEIVIAEGCDGFDSMEVFDELGYRDLSEKYDVGLVDLNESETDELERDDFLRFDNIHYPRILMNSFVISLPRLHNDEKTDLRSSLSAMVGAFPAKYYRGFFSKGKNKINKWPFKYQVHDILKCKMPDFAILDASKNGLILAGQALEMDKKGAKVLGKEWQSVGYLKLVDDSFSTDSEDEEKSN
jgi:uncharacterized protein (DUF362 family)